MRKTLPRMLAASVAGVCMGLILFELVTHMIAVDRRQAEDEDARSALAHPDRRATQSALVHISDIAATHKHRTSAPAKSQSRSTDQHRQRRLPNLKPEASRLRFKKATFVPDVDATNGGTKKPKPMAETIAAQLMDQAAKHGRAYLPAPAHHLLRDAHLQATQTRYVCPYYPGFPHVGLDLKFSAEVNRRGRVVDFTVIRGSMSPGYRAALRQAVLQWRFQPLHKNGKLLRFRIIDRVHVANVGHACVYNYTSGGLPTATGNMPRWAVYFVSGEQAPPVVMKLAGLKLP